MATLSFLLLLVAAFAALALRGNAQDDFDFDLLDALDPEPTKSTLKPTKKPSKGIDTDFDFDFDTFDKKTTTQVPKTTTTEAPPRKPAPGRSNIWDAITTKKPKPATKAPPPPQRVSDPDDFDLTDALDGKNDNKGGSDISDKDLADIADSGGYSPDKKNDGYDDTPSGQGNSEQTGTIAGVASALAMALIGAVTSYISYQQKKFCFSIQEGLNAQYAKAENLEGVAVAVEEPQVQQTLLKSQSAEPPTGDDTKI